MERSQTLTVATTWQFDNEGVEEIRRQFKDLRGCEGQCTYDAANDVFVVYDCNVYRSAVEFGSLITTFIDEEKDNDLLDKPKITRLAATTPVDDEIDAELDEENPLIDTLVHVDASLPFVKYWQTLSGGVGCFENLQYVLGDVGRLTGAELFFEKEHKRIRVTSTHTQSTDEALARLSILETPLSLTTTPRIANVLNCENIKESRLRFPVYRDLNPQALPRILVDPDFKGTVPLYRMFATVVLPWNSETEKNEYPRNLVDPPRATKPQKGGSKLWAGFKYPELRNFDELDLEELRVSSGELEEEDTAKAGALTKSPYTVDEHPYLTHEMASAVGQWVAEGVKAGAVGEGVSEPNTTLPVKPAPEPVEEARVPGIKKRRVVAMKAEQPPSAPAPGPSSQLQAVQSQREVAAPEKAKKAAEAQKSKSPSKPDVKPSASAAKNPPPSQNKNFKKGPSIKPTPQQKQSRLIDLMDDDAPTAVQESSFRGMSFSEPLIPTEAKSRKPVPARESKDFFSSLRKDDMKASADKGNAATARPRQDRPGGPSQVKSPAKKNSATEDKGKGAQKHTRGPSSSTVASEAAKAQRPKGGTGKLIKIEQEDTEVDSRVFHRTMGQMAGKGKGQKKTTTSKADAAKRQAALAEAWGAVPAAPPAAIKKPPTKALELSTWKKDKMEKENEGFLTCLKDLAQGLEPILESAQLFPGTLSLELEFGLALVNMLPKNYAEADINYKVWDSVIRPKNNMLAPSMTFFNRLTTSGADVDYMVDLTEKNEHDENVRMFKEEPIRHVWYELHCRTSHGDIVIQISQSGVTYVYRPSSVLGAVNVHCARQTWDMRAVLRGSLEYTQGVNPELDIAIMRLIEKVYVPPNRSDATMYVKVPEGGQLRLTKVLVKRATRHRYGVQEPVFGSPKKPQGPAPSDAAKEEPVFESPKKTQGRATSDAAKEEPISQPGDNQLVPSNTEQERNPFAPWEMEPGTYLQITEVQNLHMEYVGTNKSLIQARAAKPEEMVARHRLWYEASVVNHEAIKTLWQNRFLDLGETGGFWTPSYILADEARGSGTPASQPSTTSSTAARAATAGAPLLNSPFGAMFRLAHKIVERIDGVGSDNLGPGVAQAEAAFPGSSMIARSLQAVGTSASGFNRVQSMPKLESVKGMDSVSVRNSGAGGGDDDDYYYW